MRPFQIPGWDFLEEGNEISFSGMWTLSEVVPDPGGLKGVVVVQRKEL